MIMRRIFLLLENIPLGPDLYDGTSGIALFLAYLHEFTGREEYRVCSEGAIRHALCNIELIPSVTRFGFYSGQVGVAYAAVKIGVLFNEDKLLESALDIVHKLAEDLHSEHLMDLIAGNAGAIPALLEMFNLYHDEKIYNLSIRLG